MPTVTLELPYHTYDIIIESGLLKSLGKQVRRVNDHERACLIVDQNIEKSHGRVAARAMAAVDYDCVVGVMPVGEEHKNLGTMRALYQVMLDAKLERRSPVVAIGGGITGDVAGFVAATYLRGVPFIQVPTTLLAMVDASVGGKTGVNMPQGKNLIGAFHQPHLVVMDVDTLLSLPEREIRCGMAECIKHGMIRDASLLDWTVANAGPISKLETDTMLELLRRNVEIKAGVVMRDEKESGERAHLNFGHTFAHAIEAAAAYGNKLDIQHGEAVSLGMVAATRLAVWQGLCDESVLIQLVGALESFGLPTVTKKLPADDQMLLHMRLDKKVADKQIKLVLPTHIGEVVVVDDVPETEIGRAWESLRQG